MSITSTILVASKEELRLFVSEKEVHIVQQLTIKGITDIELSILWSIIDEMEFDFDDHELHFEDIETQDDLLICCLPDSFLFSLSHLLPSDIKAFAAIWAHVEEMSWPEEEAEELLRALVNMAGQALKLAKSIYLIVE